MNILVTGAFGNIGEGTMEELLRRGHRVRCFDIPNKANRRKAARLRDRAEIVWGDLRNLADLARAVDGMDTVIHLAFVIPKLSATGIGCEDRPDWAWEINVAGTRNLLQAMKAAQRPARIIFSSSLHIYGITQGEQPPRRVTDTAKPIENYARHKVECEQLMRESGLTWAIFRFAAALPFSLKLDSAMFEIPLENRMEYVHNRDVGLALANAVTNREIWAKVLHIGGGPRCRYTYREIVEKVMDAVGIGMLPASAFGHRPFSTDWIDTEESQRLLCFQRYTLDDYVRELSSRLGLRRVLARIFRPLARALLLSRSPYYRSRRFRRQQEAMWGRLAVVTCAANSFGEAAARKLAQEGMRVLLVAKPGEDLQNLVFQIRQEGGRVEVLRSDLARGRDLPRVFDAIGHSHGPIDVLLNHADLVWPNAGADPGHSRLWERIEGNLLGTIRFTELVLEDMKRRGSGHLIFVEPALKLFPARPPAMLRGVRSFFRVYRHCLNKELKLSRVRVSLVRAGIPTTEIFKLSRRRAYGIEVRPEELANRLWLLIVRPEPVIYIPNFMRLFSWMESCAGWLVELIGRRLSPVRVKSGSKP